MPLPHHNRPTILQSVRAALGWIARLPRRAQCMISGHWWRTYDILTDECACCGAKRAMTYKSGDRRPR